MSDATFTRIQAPSYAPDGSQGYQVTATEVRQFRNAVDGLHSQTLTHAGWVQLTADGRAIATFDCRGWEYVSDGPVTLTAEWVQANSGAIFAPFGIR
ncbi:hypothetical protein FHT44_005103 [Mycolicibacterium sp. BK634]|nr:hypothetical protein [Mycolicibacterium sp. BK634]